jgi:hypothetical protein
MHHQFRAIAALTTLWLSQCVTGASLKSETKETWDAYLKTRMAEMQARLKEGNCFLWLGRVHTIRSASTMSAKQRNARKTTSSFSKREKMRRKPFSLRKSRSISLRFL